MAVTINKEGADRALQEKVQQILKAINPDALPRYGVDGDFGGESTEAAIKQLAKHFPNFDGEITLSGLVDALGPIAEQKLEAEREAFVADNRPEVNAETFASATSDQKKYMQELLGVKPDGIVGPKTMGAIYDQLDIPEDVKLADLPMADVLTALEEVYIDPESAGGFRFADGTQIESPTANTAADALLAEAHSRADDPKYGEEEAAYIIRQAEDRAEQIKGLDVTAAKSGEGLIKIAKRTMAEQIEARTQELLKDGLVREGKETIHYTGDCAYDDARDRAAIEAAQSIVAVNPHQNWDVDANANDVGLGEFVVIPDTLDPNAPTLDWNALHIPGVSKSTCEEKSSCPAGITTTFEVVTVPELPEEIPCDTLEPIPNTNAYQYVIPGGCGQRPDGDGGSASKGGGFAPS
ncbi:MAG: hypothetical protein ACRBCT_04705 [Alphaproteobacteria bacterium]